MVHIYWIRSKSTCSHRHQQPHETKDAQKPFRLWDLLEVTWGGSTVSRTIIKSIMAAYQYFARITRSLNRRVLSQDSITTMPFFRTMSLQNKVTHLFFFPAHLNYKLSQSGISEIDNLVIAEGKLQLHLLASWQPIIHQR